MTEIQPAAGLMQALTPIVRRRPVQIIVSDAAGDPTAPEGALRVVVQPVRVDDKEDPEVAKGFYVAATPEELDADLPRLLGEQWVPARVGLQSLLDQVKNAAEQTRRTTVDKAKEAKPGRKAAEKNGTGGGTGAQTSILTPGAGTEAPADPAPSPAAPAAATAAAAAPAAPAATGEAAFDASTGAAATAQPPVEPSATEPALDPRAAEEPAGTATISRAEPALAGGGASNDAVSDLFD